MKILLINTISGTSATGKICDYIAQQLITGGNIVYIASAYGKSKVKGVINIPIGNKADRIEHCLMTRLRDNHGLCSTRATNGLINRIKEIKPDLIHLHNLHGYYVNAIELLQFLKSLNIPVVKTLHDCWILTGHCFNPLLAGCNKYQDASCNNCPLTHSYPSSFYDNSKRNMALKHDALIDFNNLHLVAVSKWIYNIIKSSWLKSDKTDIIRNGIDTNIFNIDCNIKKRRMILAVANVWNEAKGFSSYLHLRDLLPQDIEMVIVGVTALQRCNIPKGIKAYGYLTAKKLAHLYNEAYITISLSKGESFGMTLVESNACGTPVFAFSNSAVSEIITPKMGKLISNNDIKAMAEAIINYNGNFTSSECRNEVLKFYDKKIMNDKYIKLYKSLIYKSKG